MALELNDPKADIKARVTPQRCHNEHTTRADAPCPAVLFQMYINAGGGQQYSVMAVIDMMNQVKCDVSTVALGNVASTAVRTHGA